MNEVIAFLPPDIRWGGGLLVTMERGESHLYIFSSFQDVDDLFTQHDWIPRDEREEYLKKLPLSVWPEEKHTFVHVSGMLAEKIGEGLRYFEDFLSKGGLFQSIHGNDLVVSMIIILKKENDSRVVLVVRDVANYYLYLCSSREQVQQALCRHGTMPESEFTVTERSLQSIPIPQRSASPYPLISLSGREARFLSLLLGAHNEERPFGRNGEEKKPETVTAKCN